MVLFFIFLAVVFFIGGFRLVFELGCLCLAIIILMLLIGTIGACFGSTVLMVFIVVLLAILAAH